MTLLDRLIDPQLPNQEDKIPILAWHAAMREHLRENPTGANGGGTITAQEFLDNWSITAQPEIDAVNLVKTNMLSGTLGLSTAPLAQVISNNPSKAEVQAIQDKLNELIELLRTYLGSSEMLDVLILGEHGEYGKATVASRLGI